MNNMLKRVLKAVYLRNLSLIEQMTKALCGLGRVTLERHVRGEKEYYYQVIREDGRKKRKYVGKPDSPEVQAVIADMARRIRIEILKYNNDLIRQLLDSLKDDSAQAVMERLPVHAGGIAESCYLDRRMEELEAWANANYIRNRRDYPKEEHRACDGTRVRSKGEVIWYNILYMLGIPFRYECRIEVVDKKGVVHYEYPDFLIQCYDGSYIIIEHFGMLWDDKYSARQSMKIQNYLRVGYVLGANFFVTSDDAIGGCNSEAIRRLAELVQERFYGHRFGETIRV